jgi:hypothetical protein
MKEKEEKDIKGQNKKKKKKEEEELPFCTTAPSAPDPIWKTILVTIFGMGMRSKLSFSHILKPGRSEFNLRRKEKEYCASRLPSA